MKIKDLLSAKGLAFIILFSSIGLIADSINFLPILGASKNQSFTLFQFIGPIAGGFLGASAGALSVLLAQTISFVWLGKSMEVINLLRFLPMIFAAIYFAHDKRIKPISAAIPLLCAMLFIVHPVGGQAWVYTLYWLIPPAALLLSSNLFLRSLGATFTAHSIGSVIWLYAFPSTPAFWLALIPIVAVERILFAIGISVSYLAFNTLFSHIDMLTKTGLIAIDPRYLLVSPMKAYSSRENQRA